MKAQICTALLAFGSIPADAYILPQHRAKLGLLSTLDAGVKRSISTRNYFHSHQTFRLASSQDDNSVGLAESEAKPLTEAERLQLEAEKLQLEAEKLRLEAEAQTKSLDFEKETIKLQKIQQIDKLIHKLLIVEKGGPFDALVVRYMSKLNKKVFDRITEIANIDSPSTKAEVDPSTPNTSAPPFLFDPAIPENALPTLKNRILRSLEVAGGKEGQGVADQIRAEIAAEIKEKRIIEERERSIKLASGLGANVQEWPPGPGMGMGMGTPTILPPMAPRGGIDINGQGLSPEAKDALQELIDEINKQQQRRKEEAKGGGASADSASASGDGDKAVDDLVSKVEGMAEGVQAIEEPTATDTTETSVTTDTETTETSATSTANTTASVVDPIGKGKPGEVSLEDEAVKRALDKFLKTVQQTGGQNGANPLFPPGFSADDVRIFTGANGTNAAGGGAGGANPYGPAPGSMMSPGDLFSPGSPGGGPGGPGGINIFAIPPWAPGQLVPSLLQSDIRSPITEDDAVAIKQGVFGFETYYVNEVQKSPYLVLFKGNFRGKNREETIKDIYDRFNALPNGVPTRVQLFAMDDLTPLTQEERLELRRSGTNPFQSRQPIFVLAPAEMVPQNGNGGSSTFGRLTAGLTALLTAGSTLSFSAGLFAYNPAIYEALRKATETGVNIDPSLAAYIGQNALPIGAALLSLQLLHEVGHQLVGNARGIKAGLPILIPSTQSALLGAITRMRTFPKKRDDMFDFALAGPAVGIVASMVAVVAGLSLTAGATPDLLATFPTIPAGFYHLSLLGGLLTGLTNNAVMLKAMPALIPTHPLTIAGLTALYINALNLLPIGKLDGGRMLTACFGRRGAAIAGTMTLIGLGVSGFFTSYSEVGLFFALYALLFQRSQDIPITDEITEIDPKRRILFFATMALVAGILLPCPDIGEFINASGNLAGIKI